MNLDGTQWALIFLVVVAVLAGLLLLYQGARRRDKTDQKRHIPYVAGLHLLLEGRQVAAAKAFREAAAKGPYRLEARLRLGDLLRERGAPVQAAKVHKAMLAIPVLTDSFMRDVLISLAKDYIDAGSPELAAGTLNEELSRVRSDEVLLGQFLTALEKAGRWEQAIELTEKLAKLTGKTLGPQEAILRVLIAEQTWSAGNKRKARSELKKALSADPACAAARFVLADMAMQEGQVDKAVSEWRSLAEGAPELAPAAYEKIEKALYDAGKYGKIAEVYGAVLEKRPGDPAALLRLARHEERKGDLDGALERCRQAAESDPESIHARAATAQYLDELERCVEAASEAREIVRLIEKHRAGFACPGCGWVSEEYRWHCPECGTAAAFVIT